MENKRYLDKVLDNMIKRTKVDIDEGTMFLPFLNNPLRIQDMKKLISFLDQSVNNPKYGIYFILPFVKYCNKEFGLTEDEIDYVFRIYTRFIIEKITNE